MSQIENMLHRQLPAWIGVESTLTVGEYLAFITEILVASFLIILGFHRYI